MRNKTVLYLSPLPPPAGGIATWTQRIMGIDLPGKWNKVLVDTKVIGGRSVFSGRRSLFVEFFRSVSILSRLFFRLLASRACVVHLNCSGSTAGMARDLVCAILAKVLFRSLVVHFRCTTPVVVNGSVGRKLFGLLNRIADAVICLNQRSFVDCRDSGGRLVVVIPNFVDRVFIESLPRYEVRQLVQRVVYVGGGIESKGCGVLLEAARYFPEVEFLIVGSRSDWLDNQDKPRNVVVVGEVAYGRVLDFLLSGDVFLFPTFFPAEGFANSLLEAMACGLPCIATEWAANSDMLEDKGGIVVSPRSSAEVVEALRCLLDVGLRRKMSEWNRCKVERAYLDEKVLSQYVSIYDRIS